MSNTSSTCGSGKRISREPFLFKSAEKGACFKVQKSSTFAQTGEGITMHVLHGTAVKSLCKCKEGSKNTERVFIVGDTVDIVWPATSSSSSSSSDSNARLPENVWIVVTKLKDEKKRMWLQSLDKVLGKLKDVKVMCMFVDVIGTGAVKEGKGSTKDVSCVCVCLDGTRKLWIEKGTFPSQSTLYSINPNKTVYPPTTTTTTTTTHAWTPSLTSSPPCGQNLYDPESLFYDDFCLDSNDMGEYM